jgi:hypothetical protein
VKHFFLPINLPSNSGKGQLKSVKPCLNFCSVIRGHLSYTIFLCSFEKGPDIFLLFSHNTLPWVSKGGKKLIWSKIEPSVEGFIGMGLRLDLILVKLTISGFILHLKLKCTRRALCFHLNKGQHPEQCFFQ